MNKFFSFLANSIVSAFGLTVFGLALLVAMHAGSALANESSAPVIATAHSAKPAEPFSKLSPWLADMSARIEDLMPNPSERSKLLQLIHRTAGRYSVDPVVVLALVTVESKFQPAAVSKTGALGLMQVMPFWMKEIGHPSDDLFDVPTNLAYGCAILRHYLTLSENNLAVALANYNGGGDPDYSRKVLHQLGTRFKR